MRSESVPVANEKTIANTTKPTTTTKQKPFYFKKVSHEKGLPQQMLPSSSQKIPFSKNLKKGFGFPN